MKILKFKDFLLNEEVIHNTPESYVATALTKIKSKIEKMFEDSEGSSDDVQKMDDISNKERKEKGEMSFKDMGVELQSCEISKYSKVYDNLKIKFSDQEGLYDVTFTIDLKDAVPTDDEKDFSDKDIKKCLVKFKKYDLDKFNLIGETSKTINIDDIDEDMLINMKIDTDVEFGNEEEEFDIEIEDEDEE